MAELGDSPESQIESDFEARPSRRFSRLAGSPAVRKLSSRRLAWASLGSATLLAFVVFGGTRAVRGLAHWVASQPENWVEFADIELQPGAPPWFLSRSAGFLDQVRQESKLPDRLPILETDLDELTRAFKRHPGVRHVSKIEVGRHRLGVSLAFRKPVAVVSLPLGSRVVIDKDGVILPPEDLDWVEERPRPRVRGIAEPLLLLMGVAAPISDRPGVAYKTRASEDARQPCEVEVLKAARLADFLRARDQKTRAGRAFPDFEEIWPAVDSEGFFVVDSLKNHIYWGSAPGAELPQGILAAVKWRMLQDWIDRSGPLKVDFAHFLKFGEAGPSLGKFKGGSAPEGR